MLGFAHVGQPTVIFRVSASLSQNAWICAPRATDRDLESQRVFLVRMLGYVLVGQPTVILRRKKGIVGYVHAIFN